MARCLSTIPSLMNRAGKQYTSCYIDGLIILSRILLTYGAINNGKILGWFRIALKIISLILVSWVLSNWRQTFAYFGRTKDIIIIVSRKKVYNIAPWRPPKMKIFEPTLAWLWATRGGGKSSAALSSTSRQTDVSIDDKSMQWKRELIGVLGICQTWKIRQKTSLQCLGTLVDPGLYITANSTYNCT